MPEKQVPPNPEPPMVHKMGVATKPRSKNALPYVVISVLLVLGVVSGLLISQIVGTGGPLGTSVSNSPQNSDEIKKGQVYGAQDIKAFKDDAEGTLEKGGLDGEGSHKLVRPGGDSQTAYLTSSTLELDKFVGKKVKVWGQTYKSQKAGWFMDVGRLEVLE